tara:strand:+ start:4129 stop:5004 length:876 start_codon:yes stop_codon:yes gene_type:complete
MTLYYPRLHWEDCSQPVTGPEPKGVRNAWVIHYPGNDGFDEPLSDDEMILYCQNMQNDYVTNRGYSIGYSFVVSQSGLAYEARGFDINNAANKGSKMTPEIPNFNAVSMSIQVAVSGQNPASDAAVAKVNEIIALEPDWDVVVHADVDYTSCCGTGMVEQVRSGIIGQSVQPAPSTGDDAMMTLDKPIRMLDTRNEIATPLPSGTWPQKLPDGIPAAASAIFVTVTATQAESPGFITLWGSGSLPTVSNLNYSAGPQAVANTTLVRVVSGQFQMFNESPTHIILDVVGYTL